MSRRNPMNERYGKYTAPSGKTRKSAASAKPKRSGATGSSASSAKKTPAQASRKQRQTIHPTTPEYKRWRTVWWVCLGAAMILSTLAWWMWQDPALRAVGNWVLGGGYAMIFGAIIIDFVKLRPLRMEFARKGGGQAATPKAAKADEKPTAGGDTTHDES